ncbi:Homeobox protein HD-1 [Pseudoloma neurophilia]|uniref:Homeobox protein HD-1 n=1 Tax=Pseudoloma neurophilia TaxID=146866 RepID=A0A0R0M4P4_9MICR|nr:Homeobox protein HD-1 [Pseudoloma neurophilia]
MPKKMKEIAYNLNGIRDAYISRHNSLCQEIREAVNRFKQQTGRKSVPITDSTRKEIEFRVDQMRRTSVYSIEEVLEKLLLQKNMKQIRNISPRTRFSKTVTDDLENFFEVNPYPTEQDRKNMAVRHGLSLKQIANWFTNKRNRTSSFENKSQGASNVNE